MRRDEEIKKAVIDELFCDNRIDASKVTVTVENGIVALAGEVPSYADLADARAAIYRVAGVVDVLDSLVISYAEPPGLPADSEIEEHANNIIVWDSAVDEANVKALVEAGFVILEGIVDAHWKKWYLEEKITGIRGVLGIENKLGAVPTKEVADEILAKDVIGALERDVLVDAEDVTVTVENGVVTLSGAVPNWGVRLSAWYDASRTAGVISIENNLKVAV